MWWELKDMAIWLPVIYEISKGLPFDFAKSKLFREILQISLNTKSLSGLLYAKSELFCEILQFSLIT